MKSQAKSQVSKTSLPALDPRQRYSIDEASALLRQCRAKTYRDIAAGKIEAFKDGGRTYVSGRSIIERSTPPGCATTEQPRQAA